MSKQTAVEWLLEELDNTMPQRNVKTSQVFTEIFEVAKAMEREQMLELISFVRVHNKMGKTAEDLLQQFEAYKGGEKC
jgi:hypothetical protein